MVNSNKCYLKCTTKMGTEMRNEFCISIIFIRADTIMTATTHNTQVASHLIGVCLILLNPSIKMSERERERNSLLEGNGNSQTTSESIETMLLKIYFMTVMPPLPIQPIPMEHCLKHWMATPFMFQGMQMSKHVYHLKSFSSSRNTHTQ